MLPIFTKTSWRRTIILVWAIAWTIMVPLFHVHPEADHHHGEAGHVHSAAVHTVFSPDLDGEFDNSQHTTGGFRHSTPNHVAVSGHPSHASEYAEVGFSFLSELTDRKLPKPLFMHVLVVESGAIVAFAPTPSIAQRNTVTSPHLFLIRDIPSRAPPSLLL